MRLKRFWERFQYYRSEGKICNEWFLDRFRLKARIQPTVFPPTNGWHILQSQIKRAWAESRMKGNQ